MTVLRWVAVVACMLLVACGGKSDKDLLASAKAHLEKKDPQAAIIQLKAALGENPQSGEARYLLGQALLDTGNPNAASVELGKAADLRFSDAVVIPTLAKTLLILGDVKRITDSYAQVEFPDPLATANLKASLAWAYARQGRQDASLKALAEALRLDPTLTSALMLRASIAAVSRETASAMATVNEVLAKEPGNAEAWQLKGELLVVANPDDPAALAAFKSAVAADNKFLSGHAAIVAILMRRQDVPGIKAQVEELRKVLPQHPQTRFFQAQVAFIQHDYKTAREILQQLIKVAPTNVRVLQLAGGVEFQSNALLQAEAWLNKALLIQPGLPGASRILAQTYLRLGQPQKALTTLQPLIEQTSTDGEALALAAEAYLQSGDLKQSQVYFSKAAKVRPDDSKIRTALALTNLAKGKPEIAFSELEVIAGSDKGTFADMALISARLRRNDFDGALRDIERLERKQPDKPLAANLRGRVQLARKDMAAGRASFERALAIDPVYFPAAASLAGLDVAEKKPEQARQRFERILQIDSKNYRARLGIAQLQAQGGAPKDDVAKTIAEAVKLSPDAAETHMVLIEHYLAHKEFRAALTAAQAATAALPASPELYGALAQVQFASGEHQQAISSLNKQIQMQPQAAAPYLKLAEVQTALKDRPAALQSLRRALEIAPDNRMAQRAFIGIAVADNRHDEALRLARTVQRQRATDDVGFLFEGDIEAGRGAWDAAAKAYRAALQRGNSAEAASKLHTALDAGGKRAEAAQFESSFLQQNPRNTTFRFYLGDRALGRSEFAAAESHYRAIAQIQPNNAVVLNNIAYTILRQGKPGALAVAEKANAMAPNRPPLMDTLALALAAEKQLPRALEVQKKAVAGAPNNPALQLTLAKLYVQGGDKERARAELDKLVKLGDKFAGHADAVKLLQSL